MSVIDVKNTAALRAAGIRALNRELGADGAREFVKQYFGGSGDLTKEKYERPDMTPAEYQAMRDLIKKEAIAAGTW